MVDENIRGSIVMAKIRGYGTYGDKQISVFMRNFGDLQHQLLNIPSRCEDAERDFISELKSKRGIRVWVGKAVREEYGLSVKDAKSEVDEKVSKSKAVRYGITGETIDSLRFEYTGRRLTPTHFKMSPNTLPWNKEPIEATIKGGKRKVLSSSAFLLNGHISSGRVLPFKRIKPGPKGLKIIRTLSIPQMIDNSGVQEGLSELLTKNIGKRFEHYMNRTLK